MSRVTLLILHVTLKNLLHRTIVVAEIYVIMGGQKNKTKHHIFIALNKLLNIMKTERKVEKSSARCVIMKRKKVSVITQA